MLRNASASCLPVSSAHINSHLGTVKNLEEAVVSATLDCPTLSPRAQVCVLEEHIRAYPCGVAATQALVALLATI